MGLKVRLGLAFSGLFLSSMFGVNMLSGIKDYVDTTGNLMVDIADGIGMVSKGIEYIETYLDPDAKPTETDTPPEKGATPAATTDPPVSPPAVPEQNKIIEPSAVPGDQPAVICQKGKCYPYDPSKVKNNNLNLEAKQGVILTPAAKPNPGGRPQRREREEEEEDEEGYSRRKQQHNKARSASVTDTNKKTKPIKYQEKTTTATTSSKTTTTTNSASSTTMSPATTGSTINVSSQSTLDSENPENTEKVAASKTVLSALRGLLDNTSKLLVRLVSRIFPWNRRARRRLTGEEDEL